MYLEYLESKGIFVEDLAEGFLANKLKNGEPLDYARIMDRDCLDNVFCFKTIGYKQDKFQDTMHYFTDIDYSTSHEKKELFPHSLDRDWIKLVYSALDFVSDNKAQEYKRYVLKTVDKYLSSYRRERGEQIRDINLFPKLNTAKKVEKAYQKMLSEIEILRKEFEGIFDKAICEDYFYDMC